jgi:uncharacterized protein
MSARDFDPSRLDVAAFAAAAGELEGRWPLARFERLMAAAAGDASALGSIVIDWRVRGERRSVRGGVHGGLHAGDRQVWLHLAARTALPLECQRCLEPVEMKIETERSFLFVHGEDTAAQLDADTEDDVLALTRALDLRELIEDELLLALPLVPRHDACPKPLPVRDNEAEAGDALPHPFSALATLKRDGPLN